MDGAIIVLGAFVYFGLIDIAKAITRLAEAVAAHQQEDQANG